MLIASILLIANTIQVAAAQRKNETSIMRLVGASRGMTELPFMLEAVIATVIGGLHRRRRSSGSARTTCSTASSTIRSSNGVIPNLAINDVIIASGEALIVGRASSPPLTAFATLRLYVRL